MGVGAGYTWRVRGDMSIEMLLQLVRFPCTKREDDDTYGGREGEITRAQSVRMQSFGSHLG